VCNNTFSKAIPLSDKDNNDWIIEREKVLGWNVDIDEIKNEKQ